MGFLAFSCIYPIWYALCLSISDKAAAKSGLVAFYPVGFTLQSCREIMKDVMFFHSFWISIQRTVLRTGATLLVFHVPGLKPPPLGGQLLAYLCEEINIQEK
jgi:multiple sugar transport system permease protein/putative aldouronate transport system permease protein